MKKMITLTAALIVGLLLSGATVSAQPGGGRHPGQQMQACDGMGGGHFGPGQRGGKDGGPGMLLRFADDLKLTDSQIDQIKKLQTDFQIKMVDARAELKKARIEERSLRGDDNVSESTMFAAIDKVSAQQGQIQKMRYSHRQKISAVLTADQKDQLKELMMKRGDKMGCRGQWSGDDEDDDTPRAPRGGGWGGR